MLFCNVIICIGVCVFGDFESFCFLYLDGNRLVEFGIGSFWGFVNLQYFIFSGNQLGCIVLGVFDDFFESLEDLDLFYNNLEVLLWEVVGQMVNLNIFMLDYNFIDYIVEGIFVQFYKLVCLDMIFNCLYKFLFDGFFLRLQGIGFKLFMLLIVSFGGNFLYCNCELFWLWWLMCEDDLEICVMFEYFIDCYFWFIFEEEFLCEFLLIMWQVGGWVLVVEGQVVSLCC